jgi:hypothetical protein
MAYMHSLERMDVYDIDVMMMSNNDVVNRVGLLI